MKKSYRVNPEATESAFGRISTDAACYRPLDLVTVKITGRAHGDKEGSIRVCDPEQRVYIEEKITLVDSQAVFTFRTIGLLGAHYIYLKWEGEKRHSRYINFNLDCETGIESGDTDFDKIYPLTREAMLRGRREYETVAGRFVGYISADTWHFDGIWLRDWIYGLPAFRHWERDMACGITRFLEQQEPNGMLPDGIERDGRTWRVGLESDVEYIMVLAVWQTWQATGDDKWLASSLPSLEKALNYVKSDEKHWDSKNSLIKRQHSCDTWDFDIEGASDAGNSRHVVATCDQSGYFFAYEAMSRMYAQLRNETEAQRWREEAQAYRQRANDLLWDGTKYLHHVHLDEIDHGNFDETEQLAMGNTWAMTRGLASTEQARSIIDEYRRRHAETGDAYPWWSLQPGYPDELGYFTAPFCRQGGYANGGLMPWVGGELCRAAFQCGRESYGVELLRRYMQHLEDTEGVHVWYWPDGKPGFRTTNEVPYASWGMAEWLNATIEGLAGIKDDSFLLRRVRLSPRWAVANIDYVRATVRYAASKAYNAYIMQIDRQKQTIRLFCSGSGETLNANILLPDTWVVTSVIQGDTKLKYNQITEDASRYLSFSTSLKNNSPMVIQCQKENGK